jgi:hypothetical protein
LTAAYSASAYSSITFEVIASSLFDGCAGQARA